jgi:hypothetical protein
MARAYIERVLFVVGEPNTSKSTQLRAMYRDVRLHHEGRIPSGKRAPKLPEAERLSNERSIYVRLTSPHEMRESLKEFLDKTDDRIERWRKKFRNDRWNFAGALQPTPANKMPDVVRTVAAFRRRFSPERIRLVFLAPDRHGSSLSATWLKGATRRLWALDAEVIKIDSRSRTANGLVLADFFDFT